MTYQQQHYLKEIFDEMRSRVTDKPYLDYGLYTLVYTMKQVKNITSQLFTTLELDGS